MSVEPNMTYRFSSDIIAASVMAVVGIAAGNLCSITSIDRDAVGVSSARGETASIVLAQYNPCPNGKCRR